MPRSRCSRAMRFSTWDWTDTSSADTGSSATMNSRIEGQGPGNAHPLALAAGEFVGIPVRRLGTQAHHVQQLGHPGRALRRRAHPVHVQGLPDRLGHGPAGTQ